MTLDDKEIQCKRLFYRSWHRGTREMDLLLGSFAEKYLAGFDDAERALYEAILNHSDPDLYNWVTGQETIPANFVNPVLEKLVKHRLV